MAPPATARIRAALADHADVIADDQIDLIRQRIQPDGELRRDELAVRALYVVSDEINAYGGRFPRDEHQRIAQLLIDSPVLIGHRRDKLPFGRTFDAVLTERNGVPWVKSLIYWHVADPIAQAVAEKIDAGIIKECSISFTFGRAECSNCGQDIRTCECELGSTVDSGGSPRTVHFAYREIDRVLETSLVYRGAIPNTAIVAAEESKANTVDLTVPKINDTGVIPEAGTWIATPAYDSLTACAIYRNGWWSIVDEQSCLWRSRGTVPSALEERPFSIQLVGFRGRTRCRVEHLRAYLAGNRTPVSRVVAYTFPDALRVHTLVDTHLAGLRFRPLPHRRIELPDQNCQLEEIATRDGVVLWPVDGETQAFTEGRAISRATIMNARQTTELSTVVDGYRWTATRSAELDDLAAGSACLLSASLVPAEDKAPRFHPASPQTYTIRAARRHNQNWLLVNQSGTK